MKTFIEIGSCDFNTLNHLHYDGWRGVIVEPVIEYLDNLEKHPSINYVNAAVDTQDGERELWMCPQEYQKVSRDYRGMSSFHRDIHHGSVVGEQVLNDKGKPVHTESRSVKTITWNTLVETFNINEVDYLKIDTEGHDWEILKSIDLNKIKPKVIKIEHKHSGKWREINTYLMEHGYHTETFYYDIMGFVK
jgi:FkbM family methyltransferase|tara:strand:- start:539 stop:1111 length:573 start_codon:yes stop_codon:yes gene_type:complete